VRTLPLYNCYAHVRCQSLFGCRIQVTLTTATLLFLGDSSTAVDRLWWSL